MLVSYTGTSATKAPCLTMVISGSDHPREEGLDHLIRPAMQTSISTNGKGWESKTRGGGR